MLSKIEFKAGLIADDTSLAAEGGWTAADRVRFKRGRAEALRGWDLITTQSFAGVARGAREWTDLNGNPLMAWGTAANLYALVGGELRTITPSLTEGVLSGPFTTVNGSTTVTVQHASHGLSTGDTVTFSHADAVGGITPSGSYPITVTSRDRYTITHGSAATSSATGGGFVGYTAALPAGNVDGLTTGYGTGAYGSGPYGATTVTDFDPRIWSLAPWGEKLLANPRGRGLYEYQPSYAYSEVVINGTFDSASSWALGTGWTVGSGVATKAAGTASNLSQSVSGLLTGGYVYQVTFTVTRTAGTVAFKVNAGSPTPAVISVGGFGSATSASSAINKSGTYTRLFYAPSAASDIVFEADSAFAGTIDGVSVKLHDKAYRVENAPANIDFMFVDPNRIVVCLACQEADGDYSPLLVRWSHQENNRQWLPNSDNLAGEFTLATGGRALTGIASRQQNVIWTDSGVYSMQFTGDSGSVFSFRLLGTGCGAIGRLAVSEHNGLIFWVSPAGFFIFQGAIPQKVDCPIQRYVFDNLALHQNEKIWCGVNGLQDELWIGYADKRDGIECSRIAVYNWIEQHWTTHAIPRSSWISSGIFPYPIGFGTEGALYYHETGDSASGNPINPWIESAYWDIEDGNNLCVVKRVVPDFEEQAGAVSVTIKTKPFPNGGELTFGPYISETPTTMLNMRVKARQVKLLLSSTATNSFWRLGALRLDVEKSGARR